jgi:hypothetical protein
MCYHQYIGTTDSVVVTVTVASIYWWKHVSFTNRQGIASRQQCQLHQYIGGKMSVPPTGKELLAGSTKNHITWIFLMLAAPIYRCVERPDPKGLSTF